MNRRDELGPQTAALRSAAGNTTAPANGQRPRGRRHESMNPDRDAGSTQADVALQLGVAERIAPLIAVNNELRGQVAALSARNREITLLGKMNEFLQTSTREAEAYAVIAETSTQLFPGDSGAVFVLSASRAVLELAAVWGQAPSGRAVFAPSECWAQRRGRSHVARGHEPRCSHVADGSSVSMCVPLLAAGETLGIVHILEGQGGNSSADEQRMAEKCRLAKSLADDVGRGIGNLRLRETLRSMAIRDPLTGLHNRRYMEEALAQELCRSQRNAAQLAIVMLDIDHFKQFNDNFGHDAGDAILRRFGEFLKEHVRGSDIACRYGGDEFILLLSASSGEGGAQRAEQIRGDVRQLRVAHAGGDLGGVTLSLGVAVFPDDATEARDVVRAADFALYQAKRRGRDRVVVFSRESDQVTLQRPQANYR